MTDNAPMEFTFADSMGLDQATMGAIAVTGIVVCLVAVPVARVDHDLGPFDLGVIGENSQRIGKHRRASKWEILLRNIARALQPFAPAARHNYRYRRCHWRSKPRGESPALLRRLPRREQCGRALFALAK